MATSHTELTYEWIHDANINQSQPGNNSILVSLYSSSLLHCLTWRGVVDVVGVVGMMGVVGVALFRTRSLLVPGFYTDIFSTYTYLQCIQPFLLL